MASCTQDIQKFISELKQRVLDGGKITFDEAMTLSQIDRDNRQALEI